VRERERARELSLALGANKTATLSPRQPKSVA